MHRDKHDSGDRSVKTGKQDPSLRLSSERCAVSSQIVCLSTRLPFSALSAGSRSVHGRCILHHGLMCTHGFEPLSVLTPLSLWLVPRRAVRRARGLYKYITSRKNTNVRILYLIRVSCIHSKSNVKCARSPRVAPTRPRRRGPREAVEARSAFTKITEIPACSHYPSNSNLISLYW